MKYLNKLTLCFMIALTLTVTACTTSKNTTQPTTNTPMIMVDGRLYKDTGLISSFVQKGIPDGTIDSCIEGDLSPNKDNESNFGTNYDYIIMEDEIDVYMNGHWEIFTTDSNAQTFPKGVAHIDGIVQSINNDQLTIHVTNIPSHYDLEVLETSSNDPLLVSFTSNKDLNNDMLNKTVTVYFDGVIKDGNPLQLSHVYDIVTK